MKVEIEEITIRLNKREANSILNILNKSFQKNLDLMKTEEEAFKFKNLLSGNFHSSVPGVHTPKYNSEE